MAGTTRFTTEGRGRVYDDIVQTVGNTPVVRINSLAPEGVELYVKAEFFNPAASVKDRLALGIIEAAERDGSLKPGQTVIEATSGNTGIGLALCKILAVERQCYVYLGSRSVERGRAGLKSIVDAHPEAAASIESSSRVCRIRITPIRVPNTPMMKAVLPIT